MFSGWGSVDTGGVRLSRMGPCVAGRAGRRPTAPIPIPSGIAVCHGLFGPNQLVFGPTQNSFATLALTHGERVNHARAESLEQSRDALRLEDTDKHRQHLPLLEARRELAGRGLGLLLLGLLVRARWQRGAVVVGAAHFGNVLGRHGLQARLDRVERVHDAARLVWVGGWVKVLDARIGEDGAERAGEGRADGGEGLLVLGLGAHVYDGRWWLVQRGTREWSMSGRSMRYAMVTVRERERDSSRQSIDLDMLDE